MPIQHSGRNDCLGTQVYLALVASLTEVNEITIYSPRSPAEPAGLPKDPIVPQIVSRERGNDFCRILSLAGCLILLTACGESRTTSSGAAGKAGDRAILTPDARTQVATNWIDATVPAGTEVSLELISHLDSETTTAGSLFQARVSAAIQAGGIEIVPVGSVVEGIVKEAEPAGRGGPEGGALTLGVRVLHTPLGTGGTIVALLTSVRQQAGGLIPIKPGGTAAESIRLSAGAAHRNLALEPGTSMTMVLGKALDIKVKQQS